MTEDQLEMFDLSLVTRFYNMINYAYANDRKEEGKRLLKTFSHPWTLIIYEILEDANQNGEDPLPIMQIAKEIYIRENGGDFSDSKKIMDYQKLIHQLVDKLGKSGIIEASYSGVPYKGRKGRIRRVELKTSLEEYLGLEKTKVEEEKSLETYDEIFEVLGHKNRLKLLRDINEKTIEQIANECRLTLRGLQTHVKILKDAGLIEKRGKKCRRTRSGDRCLYLTESFHYLFRNL
jgi:DNA-binding transcriptional ArsR family regulator